MQEPKFEIVEGVDEQLKQRLQEEFQAEKLDIEDVFTYTQLAKIERKDKYLYIALHFPQFDKANRHFISKEVHCFITNEKALIIDKDKLRFIPDFLEVYGSQLSEWTTFDAFYEMLDYIVTRLFKVIGKFQHEIKAIEDAIFTTTDKQQLLLDILVVKRNLINYLSIIGPLYKAINELETKHASVITPKGLEKIDDSYDKIEKILNNLTNYRDQITLLKETNQTLIATSTNETVKKLTGINLLVFVPSIVTSFFGMNVYFGVLGREQSWWPMIWIIAVIVLVTVSFYLYFRKKGWI